MQPHALPPQYSQAPASTQQILKANKLETIWGIVCLVGPTALLVVTILGYAILNFAFGASWGYAHGDSSLFPEPTPLHSFVNILLFLVGVVSVLTWVPGIVVGIILLSTRRRA